MARTVIKGDAVTWMHLSQPTEKDFAYLEKTLVLPEAEREHHERIAAVPRLRGYGEAHTLVLHIPGMAAEHGRLERTELTAYVAKNTVVTIAKGHIRPLEEYVRQCSRLRTLPPMFRSGTSSDVVSFVLHAAIDGAEAAVEAFLKRTKDLQHRAERRLHADITVALGDLRRDAFALDMVIEPAGMVVAQFLDTAAPYKSAKATASLQVLADRIEGLHRTLIHAAEMVQSMFQVRESLLAHRTNRIVQTLTTVSVLLMPPTLIASYYGMNISGLPLGHDIRLVTAVLVASIALITVVLAFLHRR